MMTLLTLYLSAVRVLLLAAALIYAFRKRAKPAVAAVVVLLLSYFPPVFSAWLDVGLDPVGEALYIVVIVMALFLGSALKFYDRYAWWDRVLHLLSGIVLVSFGVALSQRAGELNKGFLLFFCATYSVSHHILWELLEYASDRLFATDHQRWQKESASVNHLAPGVAQPAGLVDTMNDTLACIAGTLVAVGAWWLIL